MTQRTLIIKESALKSDSDHEEIDYRTLKGWCKSGKIFRKFRTYHQVAFNLDCSPKYRRAVLLGSIGYFLKKGSSTIQYADQKKVNVTFFFLFKRFFIFVRDLIRKPFFLSSLKRKITKLEQNVPRSISLYQEGTPYYFRTDFHFNLITGGSVGHIAGVLNNLEKHLGTTPIFLTSTTIPTVKIEIESHIVTPEDQFLDYNNFPNFAFSQTYTKKATPLLEKRPPQLIYERYSCGSISGVELSQKFQVPLVLEYNGSEIWVGKNWGKSFLHENIFLKLEELNLHAAQLIVVVSQPLKEQLLERGIEEKKIFVNPNGVNPEKYSPSIDGTSIRNELKLNDKIVIGFIGTFGKWHGAEILVESFGKLLSQHKNQLHLLMIGDGITMPQVMETVKRYQMEDCVTLTGAIPQAEAPSYLAACDILASPHVPNSDGSKFFGSPTKLFEYMAMGKGIVASDLDQIGEVLNHEKTAYLVKPGEKKALIEGLKVLIEKPKLRNVLGGNAREEVVKKYTWNEHTYKIIERLKELCPPA